MAWAEYAAFDGLGLAELVRKNEVTPLELLDAAIERIERHNGVLNAVVYKAYDEARAAAQAPLADGPFKGVPFLIKDLGVRVKNWPRTSGSRFACVDADAEDSELITRYRAAGVVLAGKTNTPRASCWRARPTRRNSASLASQRQRAWARAAIRGTRTTFPGAPPAARRAR
jgi:amidase